eukprot:377537-Prorocentrum_minimum.AAC.1
MARPHQAPVEASDPLPDHEEEPPSASRAARRARFRPLQFPTASGKPQEPSKKRHLESRTWKCQRCTVVGNLGDFCRYLLPTPPGDAISTHSSRRTLQQQHLALLQQRSDFALVGLLFDGSVCGERRSTAVTITLNPPTNLSDDGTPAAAALGTQASPSGVQSSTSGVHASTSGVQASTSGVHASTSGVKASTSVEHTSTSGVRASTPGVHFGAGAQGRVSMPAAALSPTAAPFTPPQGSRNAGGGRSAAEVTQGAEAAAPAAGFPVTAVEWECPVCTFANPPGITDFCLICHSFAPEVYDSAVPAGAADAGAARSPSPLLVTSDASSAAGASASAFSPTAAPAATGADVTGADVTGADVTGAD